MHKRVMAPQIQSVPAQPGLFSTRLLKQLTDASFDEDSFPQASQGRTHSPQLLRDDTSGHL